MAGIKAVVTTEGEIALTAATAKTVLQLVAPTNQRLHLKGFGISFDGTSSSAEPVQVDILKQTTAGTMSSATPVKDGDPGSETLQATAQKNATSEPTAGDVLRRYEIHPQGGGYERVFEPGELCIPGGTRLGLRATAPANVNCVGFMSYEE